MIDIQHLAEWINKTEPENYGSWHKIRVHLAIAEQLQEQSKQLKRIANVQEEKLAILRAKAGVK